MSADRPEGARRPRWIETQLVRRGLRDEAVLDAMAAVPRETFVPGDLRDRAYADRALPIGSDQTISQPYIVAAMTEALRPGPDDRILEIGTGSGYQTAVLAEIVDEVWTIERFDELAGNARRRLEELGYGNIRYRVGDGTLGWEEGAPYQGIIVTAAAPEPPDSLVDQLDAEGGRLVLPVGTRVTQDLYRYVRDGETLDRAHLMGVRFVPLVGEEGFGP